MKNLITKKLSLGIALLIIALNGYSQQFSIQPLGKITTDLKNISTLDISNSNETLIAADEKGSVKLYSLDDFSVIAETSVSGEVLLASFDRENNIILVTDRGETLKLKKENLTTLKKWDIDEKVYKAFIHPDKNSVGYITKDNILRLYDVNVNMQSASIDFSNRISKDILFVGYDRFGQSIVIVASDGTTLLINPINQKIVKELVLRSDEFSGSASVMHAVSSTKGSELLVSGVQEVFIPKGGIRGNQPERRNSIIAFDWDTHQEVKRIRLNDRTDEIVIGPGPSHITYFTKNKFDITLVDLDAGQETAKVTLEEFPVVLDISDDDGLLAVADKDEVINVYGLYRNLTAKIKVSKPSVSRGYGDQVVNSESIDIEGAISNLKGIKRLVVNNQPAEIKNGNEFTAKVDLVPGKNKIRIIAEDLQSNTVYKDIYVTRNPEIKHQQVSSEAHLKSQKRLALVIGNASYEGTARLNNTVNDANDISAALSDLGFEVHTVIDGNYETMKNAIYKFGHSIQDVDVSVFFYAGHGIEIDGVNYLVPTDAILNNPLDVKQQTIPLTGVLNTVEYANEDGLNMIILDACRNNPFPTGRRGGAGLAKSTPPGGTIIAYSTSPGNVASDGDGDNGLYTSQLVKQLRVPQRIEDVFMKTRINVEEISNGTQKPWEEARLKGIFYLTF